MGGFEAGRRLGDELGRAAGVEAPKTVAGGLWETVKTVLWALLIAGLFRTLLFQPFWIPSGSMKDTLLIGDFLFVNKMAYGYSYASCPSIPFVGIQADDVCGWARGDGLFSLGRWGLAVNIAAVVWGIAMAVNLGWPRPEVFGSEWYMRFFPELISQPFHHGLVIVFTTAMALLALAAAVSALRGARFVHEEQVAGGESGSTAEAALEGTGRS